MCTRKRAISVSILPRTEPNRFTRSSKNKRRFAELSTPHENANFRNNIAYRKYPLSWVIEKTERKTATKETK